jgi:hypothetical protein
MWQHVHLHLYVFHHTSVPLQHAPPPSQSLTHSHNTTYHFFGVHCVTLPFFHSRHLAIFFGRHILAIFFGRHILAIFFGRHILAIFEINWCLSKLNQFWCIVVLFLFLGLFFNRCRPVVITITPFNRSCPVITVTPVLSDHHCQFEFVLFMTAITISVMHVLSFTATQSMQRAYHICCGQIALIVNTPLFSLLFCLRWDICLFCI